MPFTDDDIRRLYETLKNKENVENFSRKNRQKIAMENDDLEKRFDDLTVLLQKNQEGLKSADLVEMVSIVVRKSFEAVSDLMAVLEISFQHNIETRERITDILNKTGDEQRKEIDRLSEELTSINKHKDNLEWLDRYFKHSSEISSE